MCQTLGYHRLRTRAAPENESKPLLFWATYLLDKALSLRSGRAPAIQDYDITVPRDDNNLPDDSRLILNQWITYADVLGRAYEQLYSPAGLARPPEQRVESARQLATTMRMSPSIRAKKVSTGKQLVADMGFLITSTVNLANEHDPLMRHIKEKMRRIKFHADSPFAMEMAILGDELLHWSLLTLIYRAIPSPPGSPSTFNPECIDAARQAFATHQEYMQMAGESLAVKAGFIRW